jgi:diguanylate cyclase (GGDEF)-like protein
MTSKETDIIVDGKESPESTDQFWKKDIQKERSQANLLVVDDEEIVRNILVNVLMKEGYKAVGFEHAEDALEKMSQGQADIVITDLNMKKMGGMELLKKTKGISPETDVIVITGYASVETAVESMKLGAVDYLTKPLNIDHVKLIVDKTLERRILKRKAEESLFYQRLSRIDGMTELFNHRFFQELLNIEIARALRESWPVSLIMLDIDDFKIFNDKNGHRRGDMALKKTSGIIKKNSRNCDFVARYGGEEFAVIVPNLDKKHTGLLAGRIREKVENTKYEFEEILPQGKFTVSLGVAEYPKDASSIAELIEKADQALYKTKRNGKNNVSIYNG